LGELARHDINQPDVTRSHVDDIFRAAKKLTRSVDEIVWALNPANDTIDHFAAYVGDYAQDFLHSANLDCRLSIPDDLPGRALLPQTRHGLFLIIKEVLHNIVSHAKAQLVTLRIEYQAQQLTIEIVDDGCGFDPASPRPSRPGGGHGLANIRQRVIEMEGTLDIQSKIGDGCRVKIQVPLSTARLSPP
jgi:signal transduction histidine kinase